MDIVYDSPVNTVLAREASPIRSITNAECKLAMYAHVCVFVKVSLRTHEKKIARRPKAKSDDREEGVGK
jgi:hypothetical protein